MFPLLYDNDVIAYLRCEYDGEHFSEESERLAQLCGALSTTSFELPAYIYQVDGGGLYFQYALLSEETHTICYITLQNPSFAEAYLDPQMLPGPGADNP